MAKTEKKLHFYSRMNPGPRHEAPAGCRWAPKCIVEGDKETGGKVLKDAGAEDRYAKIQEALEPSKIQNIIRRFQEGDPTALQKRAGAYMDIVDSPTDIISAHKKIEEVKEAFTKLPAKVKEAFGSNPIQFMAEIINGNGLEKLKGLEPNAVPKTEEVKADEPKP